jgi:hypothetical protein
MLNKKYVHGMIFIFWTKFLYQWNLENLLFWVKNPILQSYFVLQFIL